jgi:[acyl-carrier-protein] S-malonyltransferase
VLKVRSDSMQRASEQTPSGLMTAILNRKSNLNLAMLAARKWCIEKLNLNEPIECQIANYLSAQVRVIGGNKQALDFIETNYKEFDIVKLKRLPVSGAFHTKLMKPAEEDLKHVLKDVYIKKPLIQFYSNYDSELVTNPEKIRKNLIKQVSNPVRWEQILNRFYYDENLPTLEDENINSDQQKSTPKQSNNRMYPDIFECGPGSQTGPILKIINKKAFQFYKHISA